MALCMFIPRFAEPPCSTWKYTFPGEI